MSHLWVLALALAVDALIGDPPALWRRIPHPVAMIGATIGAADRLMNRESDTGARRRALGWIALGVMLCAAFAFGLLLTAVFSALPFGWIGTLAVVTVLLAGRSLFDHVRAVARALDRGLDEARIEVAHIVGRDPESLDAPAIARASIESLAENFSDGVVAPAFWFAVLGLPGLIAYKTLNTADSMIGHRNARYRDFGRSAARLDDFANLVPARLAGCLVALAAPLGAGRPRAAFRVMIADARRHRSPNAGWPEAAMAGALGVALAGPRHYGGAVVRDPFLNPEGNRTPTAGDVRRGLSVYVGSNALLLAVVVAVAWIAQLI